MIAVDWSHTKKLTTYDGHKLRVEDKEALLKRLGKSGGGESTKEIKSIQQFHPPIVILENGCPLSLIYDILQSGAEVKVISNRATQDYRVGHKIEKSDENDAKIIRELAQSGAKLTPINLSDGQLLMYNLYHQYCRYQKSRVALMNQKKAHLRQYGDADMLPYDIAIDGLKAKENGLLKQLGKLCKSANPLVLECESKSLIESNLKVQPPNIRGLGERLWIGILMTANPRDFKCLSAYLRFCGLTGDVIESHKYNRHARMLYHLLAEEIVKQRDTKFRPLYDKFKVDMAVRYEGEKKFRINNAALNRTATFLAKAITSIAMWSLCRR
jgi:hypothetical protein